MVDFRKKLSEDFGFVSGRSRNGESIFAVVKDKMTEANSSRDEVLYKVLTELKERNMTIDQTMVKRVKKLLSNLLTYVRKEYPGFSGQKLIETNDKFQIVFEEETEDSEDSE